MTDLPSNQAYIQVEETDSESPISEQTMQKIGSAINFINDLFQQAVQYTSSGSFTVPEGITRLYVLGYGGGGGGGIPQGGGGSGCIPQLVALPVTPLDVYTVTIGGGGAGGTGSSFGSAGGDTSFINNSTGYGPIFYGGAPGGFITTTTTQAKDNGVGFGFLLDHFINDTSASLWNGGTGCRTLLADITALRVSPTMPKWSNLLSYTLGGAGDTDNSGNGSNGMSSPYGNGGTSPQAIDGGGGGGAGFGNGGNGAAIGNQGGDAAANSGAGGGGGNVSRGGNGGSGGLFVLY